MVGLIITDEDILNYKNQLRKEYILKYLKIIDSRKIRAIADSLLNNDNTKLQELEQESQILRDELRVLNGDS